MNNASTNHSMPELNRPWLVAVWPGMGHVALSAGIYLMSKLGMRQVAEFSARDLFDIDHVDVERGLIRMGRIPTSRFFVWKDPAQVRDIVVFIGEAQPPMGRFAFCSKLIDVGRQMNVERIFTFAAMATQMHPEHPSRVFAAATDPHILQELTKHELEALDDGQISGLNGLLLGAAAEAGLSGACLLGEMPHIFAQFSFPKAALAVLEAFAGIAAIQIDLDELRQHAEQQNERLGELLAKVESAMQERTGNGGEEDVESEIYAPEPIEEPRLTSRDEEEVEKLFSEAAHDRSKAYELKQKLDQLNVFKEYEDRFLDLFK